jgi:predicted ester cyclase
MTQSTANLSPAALSRHLRQCLDNRDFDAFGVHCSDKLVAHVGGHDHDLESWKAMGMAFFEAFPDARHDFLLGAESADTATLVCRFSGTHEGALMGIPATGRKVSHDLILVDRIVDGRLVEHWGQFDTATLMKQITGEGPQA